MRLKYITPPQWTEIVLGDLDAFLLDHAACERKASATAMKFVTHYPDRPELVSAMIDMALEELEHFKMVHTLMLTRGLIFIQDTKNAYVDGLRKLMRHPSEAYFLDRLLVSALIEARSCERFGLLAEALPSSPLKDTYMEFTRSEARHHGLFVRLARTYHGAAATEERLETLLLAEADIVSRLPLRPAVH